MSKLTSVCSITTGKLDSNAAVKNGKYPFFTCAPEPLRIDNYAFNTTAILLAGNNAQGNFHINKYSGKFNAYQRTYVITQTKYSLDYIYYYLKLLLGNLKKRALGSNTKFLTMKILDEFNIKDISIENQQKITKLLSTLDEKIELNNKINSELEKMAKTLYEYWFVQFDFPDENKRPYKSWFKYIFEHIKEFTSSNLLHGGLRYA